LQPVPPLRLVRTCASRVTRCLTFCALALVFAGTAEAATLTLAWDPVPEPQAIGYKLLYGTSSGNYTTTITLGLQTTYIVTGLADGTTYYFAVQSFDASGNASPLSQELFATTPAITENPPPAPGAFNKTSPSNDATGQPATVSLTWGPSSGATGYEYCYDTSNNNACDGSWVDVGGATTASLPGLAIGTSYYWQVRARNATGATMANSGAWWRISTVAATRIIAVTGNLAFGNAQVGTTGSSALTIINTGNSPLTVSSIGYPPGFAGDWSGSIAPGGAQSVAVTFLPAAAVIYGGTVTVNANHTSGINAIAVSGTGSTCSFSLTATAETVSASGATGSIGVLAAPGCAWTVLENSTWLSVGVAAGTGDGTVSYTAAANSGADARTAVISISGQTFTLTQPAATSGGGGAGGAGGGGGDGSAGRGGGGGGDGAGGESGGGSNPGVGNPGVGNPGGGNPGNGNGRGPRPKDVQASWLGSNLTVSWTPAEGQATANLLSFYSGVTLVASVMIGPETSVSLPIPPGTEGTFSVIVTPLVGGTPGPPSEPLTFHIGPGDGGCSGAPLAPGVVTGSVASGTATVSWLPAAGATSYVVQAGSSPNASDLFNGNVGNVLSVSASGLPAGFRAFVRVLAVSACGNSGASAEVLVQ
jgi:hypothetical protein